MKLSRNVLVGSLAVSGMVLGAIAPAVTAQAATTTGQVDATTGLVTRTAEKSAGQLGKGNLAIAYDGDGATGTASATSNASVQVVNGVLVLDKVPDFNFGAAASGSVKGLADNSRGTSTTTEENTDGTAPIDGNDEGSLQVIESRAGLGGFNVTAALGQFKDAEGTAAASTATTGNKDFILHLSPADMTLDGY